MAVLSPCQEVVVSEYLMARWKDKRHTNDQRKQAREALSLALDRLSVAGGTDSAPECADALSDASAHVDQAQAFIESAFRGIDS